MILLKPETGIGKSASNHHSKICQPKASSKIRALAQGVRMTKVEAFDKAWRLGFKGDFSLFDEIYHPEFKGVMPVADEIELNIDSLKEAIYTLKDFIIFTSPKVLIENAIFLKLHRYNKLKEADIFSLVTWTLNYKEGKIINQAFDLEELDYDPSEGQDWNWEDYE